MKSYKNTKAAAAIIICLTLMLILSGCVESEAPGGSYKVRDYLGNQVAIPENPARIACLYAFTGHAAVLVGADDRIVSVVEGLKRDKLIMEFSPALADAPVPFNEGAVNIEELIAADPDVAFIRSTTGNSKGEMAKLNSAGIPAVVVDYNNIEEQMDAVLLVGEVCGCAARERAQQYVDYYNRCIDLARSKTSGLSEEEKVTVYHSINEATRTDTKNSLCGEWTEIAGVLNVSINKELTAMESKTYASLEQIYSWNPEVIIANEPGVPDYILSDGKWSGLDAVINQRVYQMPVGVSRWGHPGSIETPLAILWLGKTVYPDLFEDVDLYEETKYFYKTFFEYELSDGQVSDILSGTVMRIPKGENK